MVIKDHMKYLEMFSILTINISILVDTDGLEECG